MARSQGALTVLLLCSVAGTASARPITLAGSKLNVELPYNWSATNVNVGDSADVLMYQGEGGGGVQLYEFASCADATTAWQTFHTGKGNSITSYGSDWLPYGWAGSANTANDDHFYCYALANGAMAVRDTNDAASNETWRSTLTSLMSSLVSTAYVSHGQAWFDNVMTLYGTGLTTALPSGMWLTSSDPSASKDGITYRNGTNSAAYTIFKRSDACSTAVTAVAPAYPSETTTTSVTGWTDYALTGLPMTAHCHAGYSTVVVLSPDDKTLTAAGGWGTETTSLLSDISREMDGAPTLGDVQTLPISGFKIALPYGWDVSSYDPAADDYDDWYGDDDDDGGTTGAKVDMIEASPGSGGMRILRAPAGCDAINTTTSPYDPAWMPDGWKAMDYTYSQQHFCTTTDAGPIEVDFDSWNGTRLQLMTILDSLRYQNTTQPTYTPTPTDDGSGTYTPPPTDDGSGTTPTPTPEYKPPRKPLLPFPLDLQLQTLKIGDNGRGWGGRLGVPLSKGLGERFMVSVRGEIGYDTETKLAYDLSGDLGWFLTRGLSVDGNVGYDRIGTGDSTAISGAVYYGIGGGWSTVSDDKALSLKLYYDWRSVPSDAAMTMDPTYPDHEWRFRGAYFWGGSGVIDGIDLEYRDIGDASSFLAGLSLRL